MSQDVGELATRLIEVREELQDIGEHVEQLDIRDREVLVEIFDDQAELCLQLAQALEVRAPFDPQDHKLDDDQVLTDGGVAIQEDWPAADSEEDEWLCPDDDCSGVITPVPHEQEIGNDIWQCDTCEEFWGWHPA